MNAVYSSLPKQFNLGRWLIERNLDGEQAKKVAFLYRDGGLSYREVARRAWGCAAQLAARGVGPGERVALLLPDSPELVVWFLGALWVGAVPVPIHIAQSENAVSYMLDDSRARVVVTRADTFVRGAPDVVNADDAAPLDDAPFDAAPTCKDEAAFWLYTSGSSGKPKGVIHAHHAAVICAELYARQTIGLCASDIVYSVARIPFAYGLGNVLTMPMWLGATAVLSDAVDALGYVRDVRRYRPSVLFGIPHTYASLLAARNVAPIDTTSLRMCLSSAESLPPGLWREWEAQYGHRIVEGVGSTETLHQYLSNDPKAARPGCAGRPVVGYDVRLVDETGTEAAPGESGLLVVGGGSLMLGYWNRLDETRRALRNGCFETGDRYVRDAEGIFHFIGRDDELFKVNGCWVSTLEIEEVLRQHAAVHDCAVLASRDTHAPAHVVAFLALKPGFSADCGAAVRAHARARLPHFMAPKQVQVVPELPRNANGKVDRMQLLQFNERNIHDSTTPCS